MKKIYGQDAHEAAFLLGGIGTGNVSVGARGELRDWEIFNRPAKGDSIPYAFFSIWARTSGSDPAARILESEIRPPYKNGCGYSSGDLAGLPRFEHSAMCGEYPFVTVELWDSDMPCRATLEAFTPFIPGNVNDSSIPAAFMRYTVKNTTELPVDVSLCYSMPNVIGSQGYDRYFPGNIMFGRGVRNEYRKDGNIRGFAYLPGQLQAADLKYGSMAVLTTEENVTLKKRWIPFGFYDGIQDFWDDFRDDGLLEDHPDAGAVNSSLAYNNLLEWASSLSVRKTIAPGDEQDFTFIIAWHFPNRIRGWRECSCTRNAEGDCLTVRNYYAGLFKDAWDAGRYLALNRLRLEKETRLFHDALFSSTLPSAVLEAVSCNLTVVRSNTCFMLEDGTFLGWEGCLATSGCCDGNCTHVWNYAQTVAFLFPELERSMRSTEFLLETYDDGNMNHRTNAVFGPRVEKGPAADGQLGAIVRLYREWKLSGDGDFLRKLWPNASRALDFALRFWDTDGDFILDGQQHNTYDIEFHGPNSMTGSLLCAALKAAWEIAAYLGDSKAERYNSVLEKSSALLDALLWNGEYYRQKLDDADQYKHQYGNGCLTDQLLGQLMAHVAGLGRILPEKHVKEAMLSVYKYNFLPSLREHHNVQRCYALNDEGGLVLCTWPHGGKPRIPFIYSDEVWTGCEYQAAAHMIYEGLVEEGLQVVEAARSRFDGIRRNPWNEYECGNHYARSMSSWALMPALSGFKYDMVRKEISFDPAISRDSFRCFWSTGTAWGTYARSVEDGDVKESIAVLHGDRGVHLVPASGSLKEAR